MHYARYVTSHYARYVTSHYARYKLHYARYKLHYARYIVTHYARYTTSHYARYVTSHYARYNGHYARHCTGPPPPRSTQGAPTLTPHRWVLHKGPPRCGDGQAAVALSGFL